jgi:hypothetical protein
VDIDVVNVILLALAGACFLGATVAGLTKAYFYTTPLIAAGLLFWVLVPLIAAVRVV